METQDFLSTWVIPHWPLFVATAIFAWVGQVMKGIVTEKLAAKKRWAWTFRKTMPLHPVVAGIVVGYSNMLPASMGADTPGAKALYFGAAGVASSYLYSIVKHFLEKKGIALKSPDELTPTPSEPPEEAADDDEEKSDSES